MLIDVDQMQVTRDNIEKSFIQPAYAIAPHHFNKIVCFN